MYCAASVALGMGIMCVWRYQDVSGTSQHEVKPNVGECNTLQFKGECLSRHNNLNSNEFCFLPNLEEFVASIVIRVSDLMYVCPAS